MNSQILLLPKSSFLTGIDRLGSGQVRKRLNEHNTTIVTGGSRAIMRCYLDLINAAQELENANYNQSELELLCINPKFKGSTSAGSVVCVLVSALVSAVFIAIAIGMSAWGVDVHGVPYVNVSAIAAYVDSTQVIVPHGLNTTCAVPSQAVSYTHLTLPTICSV